MKKRMTWKEIQTAYPDQWVGMTDVEWNEGGVCSAIVKYTDKTGNELLGMQLDDQTLYSCYTTPDNVPFLFTNWAVNHK